MTNRPKGISWLHQQKLLINYFGREFAKLGIVTFLLLFTITIYAQSGSKGNYTTKKPITVESLTKDAQVFDTLVDGGIVYYKKNTKGEDYYFIIIKKKNKDGEEVLSRKKVYKY